MHLTHHPPTGYPLIHATPITPTAQATQSIRTLACKHSTRLHHFGFTELQRLSWQPSTFLDLGPRQFAEVVKTSLLTTSAAAAGHARLADANNLLLFFVFPLLSLFLSLSPRPRPTGGKPFFDSKSTPRSRNNGAFCGKNLSWRRAVVRASNSGVPPESDDRWMFMSSSRLRSA